ncbi:MAG: VCBS repeat-containing protein, partial [Planctomycetes bacterium]|nr:VCBS repeat-containing protein [Planctomycetota bacterium]
MNPSKLAVFLARFGELLAVVGLVVVLGALDPGHLDDLLKPTFTDATSSITQGNALHGGHGIAFADVNGDGRVDIFVSNLLSLEQSTLPDELYLNQGNFVFTEESAARGISAAEGEAHAAVFVDVNGDGFVDLFKGDTNGTNELYLNDGRGYFTLTAAAGMKSTINPGSNHGTRGVGAGDFNGDGHIDLFAANSGQANELYLNRGDGTLVEEAVLRGVADEDGNGAQTQGCAIADFDGDGDLDIFLAKRFGPNRLYRNDGHAFFTEVAVAAGVAMATIDCDGGVFGDIDNDGDLDLVVAKTSTEPHGVFRNRGDGTFADESAVHPLSNERAYNILLEDLDLDGDLDLVIIFNARNAHRTYFNDGTGHFEEVKALGYEVPGRDVRCGAFADLNGDGSRDLVVVDRNTFNLLFENQGMPASGRHWLAVDVKGPQGQPSMPGAWVEIYPAGQAGVPGQRLRVAHVGGTGEGYCRADHNVAYFGLPSGTYDVQARLPSGEVVRATGVGVDRTITLDPTPPAPLVHGRFPVGQTAPVGIFHPADRLRVYVLLASFRPGAIALGPTDRRVIPLTPDRLFFASTRNLGNSPPFQRFVGQLDAQGIGV